MSEVLVSELEEGCGHCEQKILSSMLPGQMSERAVGLAKYEKQNSKLKLVTVSTSDSQGFEVYTLSEVFLLIETAGGTTRDNSEEERCGFYVFMKDLEV